MSDSLALAKNKQRKFSADVNKIKSQIQSGVVTVKKTNKICPTDKGVVYLGHIPHGFYENEMKSYFSQFGKVTNVLLCRSSKTGRSKGFGFIEFAHPEVAKIAADTMNNYLMFKKRLVAEYVPPEKQKKHMFKKKPISKERPPLLIRREKEIAKKNENISDEKYKELCKRSMRNLQRKLKKLNELGIDHTFEPVDVPGGILEKTEVATSNQYETFDSDIEIKVSSRPKKMKKTSPDLKKASQKIKTKGNLIKKKGALKGKSERTKIL